MTLPAHARCVVVGCGIVGNSVAYHLTRLGWRDVVLLDKGPLPNPGGSLLNAAQVKELVPYIDESVILGGFNTTGVGVVDSLRAGTLMREKAQAAGALHVAPKTEVTGIDVEHGRVRRVRTTDGDIEAETVVITCGVWSPRVARMAGARIPLTPAVHQMIDIGPVPRFRGAKSDIEHPIVRDMDTNMYERQPGG